ncbi:PhzF family phenazine biosynthesis protein [Vibrio lentus]|nr:PhzF family phenazine biosynthesis protein [Vibrio lentus]
MVLDIYQVDSFTTMLFKGNPCQFFVFQELLWKNTLMYLIAEEMAVSETVSNSQYDDVEMVQFIVEVKLCGHGTLATAHVMKERGLVNVGEVVTFDTLS